MSSPLDACVQPHLYFSESALAARRVPTQRNRGGVRGGYFLPGLAFSPRKQGVSYRPLASCRFSSRLSSRTTGQSSTK